MPGRTLYRFDVRQPELYAAGHIAGFRNAPGGQLVQECPQHPGTVCTAALNGIVPIPSVPLVPCRI